MIVLNVAKFVDLFKIVCAAFLLAFAGNYFFGWDFNIGLFVGLILGIWESLYEMIGDRVLIPREEVNVVNPNEEGEGE